MGLINSTTFSVIYEDKNGFDKNDLADFAEKIFKAGVITMNTAYNPSTKNYQTEYRLTGYFDESVLRKVDMYNKTVRGEVDEVDEQAEMSEMAEKLTNVHLSMTGTQELIDQVEKKMDEVSKVPKNWLQRLFSGNN
jgi:TFIIF-interacting CTD phosphatase-like protein